MVNIRSFITLIFIAVLSLTTVGCGQTGELRLPDNKPADTTPVKENQADAARTKE